jgi:hypothetical protein
MKILLLALALSSCEDFMAGYNHAKYGTPLPQPTQYSYVPYYHRTTLDDVNDSIQDLKDQQQQEALDAEERAEDLKSQVQQAADEAEERANQ